MYVQLYRTIGIEELILEFSFTIILGKGLTHLSFEMLSEIATYC